MATPITHPLETLVVSNLAQLIDAEKQLKEHYTRFSKTAASDSNERNVLSNELAALNSKADRLHRMIMAMDELMSVDAFPEALPVV